MELYSKLLSDRDSNRDDIFTTEFVHQDNNDDSISFFVTIVSNWHSRAPEIATRLTPRPILSALSEKKTCQQPCHFKQIKRNVPLWWMLKLRILYIDHNPSGYYWVRFPTYQTLMKAKSLSNEIKKKNNSLWRRTRFTGYRFLGCLDHTRGIMYREPVWIAPSIRQDCVCYQRILSCIKITETKMWININKINICLAVPQNNWVPYINEQSDYAVHFVATPIHDYVCRHT